MQDSSYCVSSCMIFLQPAANSEFGRLIQGPSKAVLDFERRMRRSGIQ